MQTEDLVKVFGVVITAAGAGSMAVEPMTGILGIFAGAAVYMLAHKK